MHGRRCVFGAEHETGPIMYVCICNALKDKQLTAVAGDASNVAQVFNRCGARPQCGKCLPDVAKIIEDTRDDASGQFVAAE